MLRNQSALHVQLNKPTVKAVQLVHKLCSFTRKEKKEDFVWAISLQILEVPHIPQKSIMRTKMLI